jgi:glycosyltransferase involved in cell wall biosynthesis
VTRIVYVINSVEGGGAALPAPRVISLLQRERFEVVVLALTRRDGRALPAFAEAGIEVRVRTGGERDHVAALGWLRGQLREISPDLVWSSLSRATVLCQLGAGRVPLVSWQHAAFLRPANRWLMRALRWRTAMWVADSEQVAALTAARLRVPRDRVIVWPLFAADPELKQAAPWQPGEAVRIGSLGRLHPVKGYDVLVEALARVGGRYEASIAGEGSERDALAAKARAAGVTLSLPGFVGPAAYLASLHLYVQPSRSEGLCVAAHEAMAAGLPVVASAVGELPSSIVEGTGLLVPPGDAAALAEAIGRLVAAPEHLAAMGEAARKRVIERFGPERFEAAGLAVVKRLRMLIG